MQIGNSRTREQLIPDLRSVIR